MNNIKSTIGWADYSWNPIVGCQPVSEGCANCYAAAISKRFGFPWGKPTFYHNRLEEPSKMKEPSKIFICSMSDFFHHDIDNGWREKIYEVICDSIHTFIILTKRIENARLYWKYMPNIWLGVTCENQQRMNERVPFLRAISATTKFISIEPILGAVKIPLGIDWVIAGGETGKNKRPYNDDWINDIAAQCEKRHIPFYDKRKNYIKREWPL